MTANRNRRLSSLKLVYPILLVLIPLLGISGSVATTTQAALPTVGQNSAPRNRPSSCVSTSETLPSATASLPR